MRERERAEGELKSLRLFRLNEFVLFQLFDVIVSLPITLTKLYYYVISTWERNGFIYR